MEQENKEINKERRK